MFDDPLMIFFAFLLNILIGFGAYKGKFVDKSGFYTGVAVGLVVFIAFGWEGFFILFAFFALGSAATKFKNSEKKKLGVAQSKDGQRSAKHVIANGGVPFILACAYLVSSVYQDFDQRTFEPYFAAFAAAVATALADTLSTEMGQVYGKKCYLLITMERVKVGTEGAVSIEGAYWGMAGAGLLSVMALVMSKFEYYPIKTTVLIFFAAVIANMIESIIGGVFNQFERSANEFLLNFSNTAIGAALCFFFMH